MGLEEDCRKESLKWFFLVYAFLIIKIIIITIFEANFIKSKSRNKNEWETMLLID